MKTAMLLAMLAAATGATRAGDAPPTEVVVIDHSKIEESYARGLPFRMLQNSKYKVSAAYRQVPATFVEIHEFDTDIFFIASGSATFVTGGTAIEPTRSGPGEFRAKRIEGGKVHRLTKGDVVIIPPGIPHQFTEVDGPLHYYVVKVTQ